MRKRILTIVFALFVFSIPLYSIVNGRSLTNTLKDLCTELKMIFFQKDENQKRFEEDYERQHQKMIDVITNSDRLSILLYTQEEEMTFDLAYALKKVTSDYKDFRKDTRPYDRFINSLNANIDRYARLIEALRRLPPVMKEIEIEILPDSLQYHNDSLDLHILGDDSYLEKEVIKIAIKDSLAAPFVLDEEGERFRDSCIFYASELLKMYADNRAFVIADSSHYQEAHLRMKEAYDYAETKYRELENYFFTEGQTPFMTILGNFHEYCQRTLIDLLNQYDFAQVEEASAKAKAVDSSSLDNSEEERRSFYDNLSSRGENTMLVIVCVVQLVLLIVFWGVTFLLLLLVSRFVKIKKFVPKKQLPVFSILLGTILYFLIFGFFWQGDEYIQLGVKHVNTLLWLLIAINGSLLLRVKPEQIRNGQRLYTPTFAMALVIVFCRNIFIPDKMLVLLFPPILFIVVVRQLIFCIKERGKVSPIDNTFGWISLAIYITAFLFAFFGYTFVALLVLVWWYFQLAALLTIACISDLLRRYKNRFLDKRVNALRERITYVTGKDRESLLFGATWLYDLIKQVCIPALVLLSLPFCIHLSLNIFDFNDLFEKSYNNPFIHLTDKNGFDMLRISFKSVIYLLILFYVQRYLNRAFHAIWQYTRYQIFMYKHNRTDILANEINLSLGNSIISVLMWFFFIVVVFVVWKIPTGSMGLIAGGLSAGIGIALKDTINNFIYGIQLMGGRVRVGDWIECEGVRGRVTSINYQCVQAETIEGTEMSFLNSSLFGKNFNNLTRNNSYELTVINVGVAYGTDINKVRDVLVRDMQVMRTKDGYGREIVDPKYGIYVVVGNMSDSAVDISVKQYVLVAERIAYVDKAKEVIYNSLTSAGITIAFPQCDVHIISNEPRVVNKKG